MIIAKQLWKICLRMIRYGIAGPGFLMVLRIFQSEKYIKALRLTKMPWNMLKNQGISIKFPVLQLDWQKMNNNWGITNYPTKFVLIF